MEQPQILIIDFGSQYTLPFGTRFRELGYRSITLAPGKAEKWLSKNKPKFIVYSGGAGSVYDPKSPKLPEGVMAVKCPRLVICYGMQLVVQMQGGKVESHLERKEYGRTSTMFDTSNPLFRGIPTESITWSSHGDSIMDLPLGYTPIAWSKIGSEKTLSRISGMYSAKEKIYGLLFHPEVHNTQFGKDILQNFADICSCEKDWKACDENLKIKSDIRSAIGDQKVIIGLSGGVDSSYVAKLVGEVAPRKNILAIGIDHGGLREHDIEDIKFAAEVANIPLKIVRCKGRYLEAIGNTVNAKAKRRRSNPIYAQVLDEEARKFGASLTIQGSIAPDLIESSKAGQADEIKEHHNTVKMETVKYDPISHLFKYEVRELAKEAGLPTRIYSREPFPGPGLYIRIVGVPITSKRLETVRWATDEVNKVAKKYGLDKKYSQCVVAIVGVKVVGIKGDKRTYKYILGVRAVVTNDFMTCTGFRFPTKAKQEIEDIIACHPEFVHVAWFEISKPPGTTEFE